MAHHYDLTAKIITKKFKPNSCREKLFFCALHKKNWMQNTGKQYIWFFLERERNRLIMITPLNGKYFSHNSNLSALCLILRLQLNCHT